MCGRFALRLIHDEIRALHGYDDVEVDEWINEDEFVPRYNIAPRTQAPVLLRRDPESPDDAGASHDSHYILHTMKWGLVPHWSKFEDKTMSTTNARSENLVEGGGMWGSIKGKKRCAIPVQGYYEWLTKGKEKLPHFTKRKDGKLLLLAGLYDCAHIEGRSLWTFTIVTTDANKDFSWLHDRQPTILSTREALDKWLDTSPQTWTSELTRLVQPYDNPEVVLECYQVPKEVGKVGTESPTFIEPVTNRKDGIQAMFSKQKALNTDSKSSVKAGTKRSATPINISDDDDSKTDVTPKRVKRDPTTSPTKSGGDKDEIKEEGKPNTNITKGSPRKRRPAKPPPPGTAKITTFLVKK